MAYSAEVNQMKPEHEVHDDLVAWLEKQESNAVYQCDRWVASDLLAISRNGPIPTLVRGLDEHVKQLEAAICAVSRLRTAGATTCGRR